MSQKSLLFLVVLALFGIAYYVRFKPHRRPTETAAPAPKAAPKSTGCPEKCTRNWNKCTTDCGSFDRPCTNRCDATKESCQAACP